MKRTPRPSAEDPRQSEAEVGGTCGCTRPVALQRLGWFPENREDVASGYGKKGSGARVARRVLVRRVRRRAGPVREAFAWRCVLCGFQNQPRHA